MKQQLNLYLEREDIKKLIKKANESGFTGKGAISRYVEKIAREPICFLDDNVKALLRSINLK